MKIKKIIISLLIMFSLYLIFNKVMAFTVVLDAGHGGHDVGATSDGIYEKDINFKVTKYLKEYLSEYKDTKIIMTRSDDTFLEIYDRAMIARKENADIFISLHFNSASTTNTNGAEVYVSNNKSLDKYNKETTILGNKILENLEKIGINNRGVRTRLIPKDETDIYSDGTRADYYGIIRYAMRGCKIDSGIIKPEGAVPAKVENGEGVPAIIIEHCYINNSIDRKFIENDEALKKLAKADADAIAEYYKLTKKENEQNKITFKIKNKLLIIQPGTTLESIKEKYKDASIENGLSTGNKIKISNEEYNVVELGDCNGDGKITPADYVKIKNHIMNVTTLTDLNLIASDVNEDDQITPADYVKVKNHIMNASQIQIKIEEKKDE
jgi:N-acetylmuramoyl-L-alanine amidase